VGLPYELEVAIGRNIARGKRYAIVRPGNDARRDLVVRAVDTAQRESGVEIDGETQTILAAGAWQIDRRRHATGVGNLIGFDRPSHALRHGGGLLSRDVPWPDRRWKSQAERPVAIVDAL